MTEDNRIQDIERYLSSEMSAIEIEAFEKKIESDPKLREDVISMQQLNQDLSTYLWETTYKEDLIKKGERLMNRPIMEKKGLSNFLKPNYRIGLIAASIGLVLLAVGYALKDSIFPPTTDEIFAQFYEPKKILSNGLLSGSSNDSIDPLIQAFLEGSYKNVLTETNRLLQDSSFNQIPQALLLSGLASLESGQTVTAIEQWEQIPESAITIRQEGEWLSALAFLKQGSISQAQQAFQSIADKPSHVKAIEAGEVLKKLN